MPLDLVALRWPGAVAFKSQKCLLPQHLFTQIGRPGQWAKCFFQSAYQADGNAAMCQIFPAEGDNACVCYLDTTVCRSVENGGGQLILKDVVPLNSLERVLEQVNLNLFLTENHYLDHYSEVSKAYLKSVSHALLKKHHFSESCCVKSEDLSSEGIEFIHINIAESKEEQCFVVNDETILNVDKISLAPASARKECIIEDVAAFQSVRRQLDDLLKTFSLRAKADNQLPLSLNALVVGQEGSGKTTLVEEFLADNHFNVFRVVTSKVLKQYPGDTESELRKIFEAAQSFQNFQRKENTAIFIEDFHLLCPEAKSSGSSLETIANSSRISAQLLFLVDQLHRFRSCVFCLATTSFPENINGLARRPGRFDREIHIPQLSMQDRQVVVETLLCRTFPNAHFGESLLGTIAKQTQGFAIADLLLLMQNISHRVPNSNAAADGIDCNVVKHCLAKAQSNTLRASSLTTCVATEDLSAIGGMVQLKKQLKVSVLAGLSRRETFQRFGLTLPKGLLLYGPPGCAKTTIAKCLAAEVGMKFLSTCGAEVYSPYVGCAEKFISKLFATARKNAPCLIFLDEIDSLVGRRAMNTSPVSDVHTRILATLLTEMDGIIETKCGASDDAGHILVVAATNRPDMVDEALLRPGRFDRLIHVPVPDLLTRHSILALLQRRMPFGPDVDLLHIAKCTETFSGADICNLCNEAAMQAFQRNPGAGELTKDDFERVMESTKSSLTRNQINKYFQFERQFSR